MSKVETDETIIGIDLGTIESCVGIMRNGKVEIVQDSSSGDRIIPSMVCFTESEELVGKSAKSKMIKYFQSTLYESKRLLGLKFNNPLVQKDIKGWPIEIIQDPETKKPQYVVKVKNEEKKFFPEDVSSMILKYIKDFAEKFNSNKPIKKAVITIPAHFNNLQREATVEAAKKAGLEVYKIINEPTAAAIAYGEQIKSDKEKKILIFDIGGGTFDVSILKIKGNKYEILSSCGEDHLGGEDFNQRLYDYIISEMKKRDDLKDINFLKRDKKTLNLISKIRNDVENIKTDLGRTNEASFYMDNVLGKDEFDLTIDRNTFEILCIDLWYKCFIRVEEALRLSKLTKEQIEEIILVGGSTRIPKIKEMIKNYFKKPPLENINVDEVVAHGATLSASLDLNVIDKTSKAIGIESANGNMSVIIPAGTVLPLRGTTLNYKREFKLNGKSNGTKVIKIYEGNDEKVKNNQFLGKFTIKLDETKADSKISIIMNIDHNSILDIKVKVNNKNNNEIEIKMEQEEKLNESLFAMNFSKDTNNQRKSMFKKGSDDYILGINIGILETVSAILINDELDVIPNNVSRENSIPSVVCFTGPKENDILVGNAAVDNQINYPQSTIFESKRVLGHKFNDEHIKEDLKKWPYEIVEDKKTGGILYVIKINGKEIKRVSPEEVIGIILKYVKENAELYVKKVTNSETKITKCILGMPVHYNDERIKSHLECAKYAGLTVIKTIPKCIAAGIGYGYEHKSNKERNILVFDVGGGNFGVSVLKNKGNEYKILAKDGKGHLGEEDFNKTLRNYIIKEIKKEPKYQNIFKDEDKTLRIKLKIKEEAKITIIILSMFEEAIFKLMNLYEIDLFYRKITRKDFEKLCENFWEEIHEYIENTVSAAKLKKEEINEIILVGFASKIPGIHDILTNYFYPEIKIHNIRGDEIVVKGATLSQNINW